MEDVSTFGKLAIILLILSLLVTVVFAAIGFTRNAATQNLNSVQSAMSSMQDSRFDDYDQQTISGTRVLSAISFFSGQPIAVVVRTKAQMAASANTGFNYGALLEGTSDSDFVTPAMEKPEGKSYYVAQLQVLEDGTVPSNDNIVGTKTNGTKTFVKQTGMFKSELVKDDTDTVVGVVFTQK